MLYMLYMLYIYIYIVSHIWQIYGQLIRRENPPLPLESPVPTSQLVPVRAAPYATCPKGFFGGWAVGYLTAET